MKTLPEAVVAYKKTPEFNENTVPKALLRDHQTKAGVWGKIVIKSGQLLYTIQGDPVEEVQLSSQCFGVVEPEVKHCVKPMGAVQFYVEFHR